MKKFTMKPVKLSKKADLTIRGKLLFAMVKKNIFSFSTLQFVVPALVLCFVAFGAMYTFPGTTTTSEEAPKTQLTENTSEHRILSQIDEIRAQKYKERAKNRSAYKKAQKYKQFALLRSSKLRKS